MYTRMCSVLNVLQLHNVMHWCVYLVVSCWWHSCPWWLFHIDLLNHYWIIVKIIIESSQATRCMALHCGKAHVQSQRERATFDLMTSKPLTFFKFELNIHNYVHEIYTSANFHFIPFSGGFSPDRWNITVLWLFAYCVFPQVEPVDRFSRFMAHTTCFRPRTVLGLRQ